MPVNPTTDHIGLCERCYAVTCPTHGGRGGGTGAVRFRCADCTGRLAIVAATSGPQPSGPHGGSGPEPADPRSARPGGPGRDRADSGLDRHPDSVLWALPALSPMLTALRGLLDPERLGRAAEFVVSDVGAYSPVELGNALGGRLLAAIDGQDIETLERALGMTPSSALSDAGPDSRREALQNAAAARVGALASELAATVTDLEPREPRPAGVTADGVAIDDLALLRDGLAAICAAHGYWPDDIGPAAMASPLDVPGALHLPAYGLQTLFAYIDESGLGPRTGSAILSPFDSPVTQEATAGAGADARVAYA